MSTSRPRVGVSSCLLGRQVRFDVGNKRSDFVADTLSRFVDFVPVCPEVESGMPVPRESLRLVPGRAGLRLIGNRSGADHTDRMSSFAEQRVAELAALELDGFVLKKDSPSCGLERVRIYRDGAAQPARTGTGLFAALLRDRLPALPLTEEGWLRDPGLRESFLERIFTHHRMRTVLFEAPSRGKLIAFHSEHKLLYMARSPVLYRELGLIAARSAARPLKATIELYAAQAMAALGERSTPGKQANVLQHIMGYFKEVLTASEKRELLSLIDDFRAGLHGFSPLETVAHVDLSRHVGTWYEIANFPQSFQRGCTANTASYTLRKDGDIDVLNRCRKGSLDGREKSAVGRARVVDRATNAKLATRSSVTRGATTSGSWRPRPRWPMRPIGASSRASGPRATRPPVSCGPCSGPGPAGAHDGDRHVRDDPATRW